MKTDKSKKIECDELLLFIPPLPILSSGVLLFFNTPEGVD